MIRPTSDDFERAGRARIMIVGGAWRRDQLHAVVAPYHSPHIDPEVRYPLYSEHTRERAIESKLS